MKSKKKQQSKFRRFSSNRRVVVMAVCLLVATVGTAYVVVSHASTNTGIVDSTPVDSDAINTATANLQPVDPSTLPEGRTRTWYMCLHSEPYPGIRTCLTTHGAGNQLTMNEQKASPIDFTREGSIIGDIPRFIFSHRGYCIKAFSNGRVEEGTRGCNVNNNNDDWAHITGGVQIDRYENVGQEKYIGAEGDDNEWSRVENPHLGFYYGWDLFSSNPY